MTTLDAIRSAGEADLQELLAKLDDRHRRLLRSALQRYGRVQDIPDNVWAQIQSETEEQVAAILLLLMMNADDWTTGEIKSQGVRTRRLTPEKLSGYSMTAARRAQRMAQLTTDTLKDRLTRGIQDRQLSTERSPVGELDLGDIDQALDDALNAKRRETIATNETTGAMSAGQRGAGQRHEPGRGSDTQIELLWHTEGDEKVCPRCSPLDGTTEDVWGAVFPDGPGEEAHVNCRCSLQPRVRALDNSAAA